jgi:hypothetical protein
MSGSASILSLFSSFSTATDPILGALYGTAGANSGNPIQALKTATASETKDVQSTAAQPAVARDVAAFEAAVKSATSPTQLLSNPVVQKVLLTASGMSDQIGYTALATKALLSNPSDTKALVNQLSDRRWLTVNQTYNFATKGLSIIQKPSVLADIANSYAEQTWLKSLDATTPGLSDALTFRKLAASISSVDQILGDPVMRSVVTTALGIPLQIAFQDLGAQERSITSQIDITQFSKPKFVTSITDRYLLAMQQQQQQNAGTTTSIESLAAQAQGLIA